MSLTKYECVVVLTHIACSEVETSSAFKCQTNKKVFKAFFILVLISHHKPSKVSHWDVWEPGLPAKNPQGNTTKAMENGKVDVRCYHKRQDKKWRHRRRLWGWQNY